MDETTPGQRLRMRRTELKITAEELGRRAALVMGRAKPISASAVRNQENGTNGLPLAVAQAYAEVLKCEQEWLLFGTPSRSPFESDRLAAEADARLDSEKEPWDVGDLAIPSYGIVSARWLPEMVKPDQTLLTSYPVVLYVPGWSDSYADELSCYEVVDNTLEPKFSKGTFLVTAPAEHAVINTGTVVLASRFKSDEVQQSIRVVRVEGNTIYLDGIGAASASSEKIMQDRKPVGGIWVSNVVISELRFIGSNSSISYEIPYTPYEAIYPEEPDAAERHEEILKIAEEIWREQQGKKPKNS